MVKNELQLHDTTKLANSTIGNANSFHGIHRSSRMLLNGCAFGWNSRHCCLLGVPLPRYGSRAAVSCSLKPSSGSTAEIEVGACRIAASSTCMSDVFSRVVAAIFSVDEAGESWFRVDEDAISSGCLRCHLVSGNMKITIRSEAPSSAVLSHQKLRQPMWSAMAPEIMGATYVRDVRNE